MEKVKDELEIFNKDETKEVVIEYGEAFIFRRNPNTIMMTEDESWLHNNILYTRCTSLGKVCNVIIDSGSYAYVIANYMVENLKLQTKVHPYPYKLQ